MSLRWEDMAEEESSRIERLRLGCLEVRWEAVSWVRRRAEEDSMAWVGVSRYRLGYLVSGVVDRALHLS